MCVDGDEEFAQVVRAGALHQEADFVQEPAMQREKLQMGSQQSSSIIYYLVLYKYKNPVNAF